MVNVSLIKKIEYKKNLSDKTIYPVTFEIADDLDRERLIAIYQLAQGKNLLENDEINVFNNTFTIQMKLTNIPEITRILLDEDILFYGIYVLYDDYLEMKEVENE